MAPRSEAVIIGGGPAGLMAAEVLAAAGTAVTVVERMPSVGRKLLLAGRGGLNLTHSEDLPCFLARYGTAASLLAPAIALFPPQALRGWSEGLGQPTFVGSSGRVFPVALKTSPLLRAWLARLRLLGVEFLLRHHWEGWDGAGALCLRGPDGAVRRLRPAATLLALGGASWPRLGSDGSWTATLAARDVAVTRLEAANCGVTLDWSAPFRGRFAGTPLKRIAASAGGPGLRGEAVVTETGLEGGVIYALSAALRAALASQVRDPAGAFSAAAGARVVLSLDLRPDLSEEALRARLDRPAQGQSLANFLRKTVGLAPVGIGLLREAALAEPDALGSAAAIARTIKRLDLPVLGLAPIGRAISSAGGIACEELDAGFMLRRLPGVFAAGEMLDWEAPTGGYLLQAAFATGAAAGRGMLAWLARGQT